MGVHIGDTLNDRLQSIEKIRNRIFNTGLFVTVICHLDSLKEKNQYSLTIDVKERWYTYVFPLLDIADRNFNEWWRQRDRDLSRLNYGFWLVQKNMRGRNETLKLKLQGGFTGKAELFYNFPYIHKTQKSGMDLGLSYIYSRSLAYNIEDNVLSYHEGDKAQIRRYDFSMSYSHRGKFYNFHHAGIQFHYQQISDTIAVLNPEYFLDSKTLRRYITLVYSFSRDKRDIQYYALKGNYLKLKVEKLGLGIWDDVNIFSMAGEFDFYQPINRHLFFATGIGSKLSFPSTQAFYDFKGLGYGNNYVRGYELYVINGQHTLLWKNSLKFRILSTTAQADWVPLAQFSTVPLAIYATANFDFGYVYDKRNEFMTNLPLPGGGLGVDFVTFYDVVLRAEYSWNRYWEGGFYLQFMGAIGGRKSL